MTGTVTLIVLILILIISLLLSRNKDAEKWYQENKAILDSMTAEKRITYTLESCGLGGEFGKIKNKLRNTILFYTTDKPPDDKPISKIGGYPSVPADFEWPLNRETKLDFLFQINLEELHLYDVEGLLPEKGLLLFFYDGKNYPDGYDLDHKGGWKVIYIKEPGETKSLEQSGTVIIDERVILFKQAVQLPPPKNLAAEYPELNTSVLSKFNERLNRAFCNGMCLQTGKLLGYINSYYWIDVEDVAYYAMKGVPSKQWVRTQKLPEPVPDTEKNKWQLLAQFPDVGNIMKNGPGYQRLHFLIKKEDLKKRHFDDVWAVREDD